TRRGTIRARLPGRESGPARAVVTHLDTIGAMVRYIRDDGRVLVAPIGHWSSRLAEGGRVTIFSENGAYRGCLLPTLEWGVSRDQGVESVPMDWDHVELRLEEAVFNADDVRDLGIEIGNFIALDSHPEVLENGYIIGRNLDNKAGTAAVLETLRHLTEEHEAPTHDTYVLFTISETTGGGMGGAVFPEVSELVTVDFESVAPTEKSPFKRVTLASGDASGPYDYHLTSHLHELAERKQVPLQQKYLKAFHSDTAAALIAGHDVRTAVLAYAGDASHSVERTHIESLTNLARILEAYVTSEPTFARDRELTTVDKFSTQIDSNTLPCVGPDVPDTASVIRRGATRDPGD
ncbi:MAG: M20/M25/M40 family metallo-hydrolase, partial [Gammaproteobacteria bacterium]|nr:M20/M25/M40 family metallo-hydrolase [Gammaproteobacteria bacterium]